MSIMGAIVVRELGIMHLMVGHESYKTTSGCHNLSLGLMTKARACKGMGQK
jgi:hypothetical protein